MSRGPKWMILPMAEEVRRFREEAVATSGSLNYNHVQLLNALVDTMINKFNRDDLIEGWVVRALSTWTLPADRARMEPCLRAMVDAAKHQYEVMQLYDDRGNAHYLFSHMQHDNVILALMPY